MYLGFLINKHKIEETNEIYVYLGTYKINYSSDVEHGASDYRLDRDDPKAQYRLYRNIENEDTKQVPISFCDEFESTYNIIFPDTYFTEKYFYAIQKEFVKDLINFNQEEACAKVLKKSFDRKI